MYNDHYQSRILKGVTECIHCKRKYSNTHTLRKHVRTKHRLSVPNEKPGPIGHTENEKKARRMQQSQIYHERAAQNRVRKRIDDIATDYADRIDDAEADRSTIVEKLLSCNTLRAMPQTMQYAVWLTLKDSLITLLNQDDIQNDIIPTIGSRGHWAKANNSRRNEWKIAADLWAGSSRVKKYMHLIVGLTKAIHNHDIHTQQNSSNLSENEEDGEASNVAIRLPSGFTCIQLNLNDANAQEELNKHFHAIFGYRDIDRDIRKIVSKNPVGWTNVAQDLKAKFAESSCQFIAERWHERLNCALESLTQ